LENNFKKYFVERIKILVYIEREIDKKRGRLRERERERGRERERKRKRENLKIYFVSK
jgi:hypothetical protein